MKITRQQLKKLIRESLDDVLEPETREKLRTMGHDPDMAPSAIDLGLTLAGEDFNMDSFKQQVYDRMTNIVERQKYSNTWRKEVYELLKQQFIDYVTGDHLTSALPTIYSTANEIVANVVNSWPSANSWRHMTNPDVDHANTANIKKEIMNTLQIVITDPMELLASFIAGLIMSRGYATHFDPKSPYHDETHIMVEYLKNPHRRNKSGIVSMLNLILDDNPDSPRIADFGIKTIGRDKYKLVDWEEGEW